MNAKASLGGMHNDQKTSLSHMTFLPKSSKLDLTLIAINWPCTSLIELPHVTCAPGKSLI